MSEEMLAAGKGVFGRMDRSRRLPAGIADSISTASEAGHLRLGDRLPTGHALSEQFGVARTVVREAVPLLKHDGVIRARRGVGAFVATIARHLQAMHDAVFEALRDQDPRAARAATRHHFEQAAKRLIACRDFADV